MKEKLIQPMKRRFFGFDEIGIARNPTIKDLADLYLAMQDQKGFSFVTDNVFVNYEVGSRSYSITDHINLQGIAKTKDKDTEVKKDSHIYLNSDDEKYYISFSVIDASRQPVIDENPGLKNIIKNYFRRRYDKKSIKFIIAEHGVLVNTNHLINFAKTYSDPDGMTMVKAAKVAEEAIDPKKISQLEECISCIRL